MSKYYHHYEINVSLNGNHLFATHERSLNDIRKLRHVLALFQEKFPPSEGFQVLVSGATETSTFLNADEILGEE